MPPHDTRSNMNEPIIICPNCKTEIRLTEISCGAPYRSNEASVRTEDRQ